MKKIVLTVAAVLAFGFANAQDSSSGVNGFSKGNMWAEGSLLYHSTKNDVPTDVKSEWAFDPKIGYMLNDRWGVGGFLDFSGGKLNNNDKFGTFGIGAFARNYFLSLGEAKSFQAYSELGLGYSSITNDPDVGSKTTDSAFNANVSIGLNYFFNPNWAATMTFADIISYNNSSPENGDTTSDFNLELNLFQNPFAQAKFGLLYKW